MHKRKTPKRKFLPLPAGIIPGKPEPKPRPRFVPASRGGGCRPVYRCKACGEPARDCPASCGALNCLACSPALRCWRCSADMAALVGTPAPAVTKSGYEARVKRHEKVIKKTLKPLAELKDPERAARRRRLKADRELKQLKQGGKP